MKLLDRSLALRHLMGLIICALFLTAAVGSRSAASGSTSRPDAAAECVAGLGTRATNANDWEDITVADALEPEFDAISTTTKASWVFEQQNTVQQSPQKDVRELRQGQMIERELAAGETHTYRIALSANQYLNVFVEQLGVNIEVTLSDPKGEQIANLDWWFRERTESLWASAESTGAYVLKITSPSQPEKTTKYRIKIEKIEEFQQASAEDRDIVTAHKYFAHGKRLLAQGTAESRREAIQKFEESLSHWRALGNRKAEATTFREIGNTYSKLSDLKKSVEYLNHSLSLWRSEGDQKEEAVTLNDIGVVCMRLGETQEALKYYFQALPAMRTLKSRTDEAVILANIGAAYSAVGESQKAQEYFSQALPIFRDLRVVPMFSKPAASLFRRLATEAGKWMPQYPASRPVEGCSPTPTRRAWL